MNNGYRSCKRCGDAFERNGKLSLCPNCKNADDVEQWRYKHYFKSTKIESNIDFPESWNRSTATCSCKICGSLFTHDVRKINYLTRVAEYCPKHRSEYQRIRFLKDDTIQVEPHQREVELERYIELGEAIGDIPKAVRMSVGIAKDNDIKVYNEIYEHILKTRGHKYFERN